MNFDVNTLSTLMQLMSAMKPTPQANRQDNARENAYEESRNTSNGNASVFAMQNGLGQKIEFGESKPKSESKNTSGINPMSSILEMMTGAKNSGEGSGDMMSSLLPMLMNMMSGRTQNQSQAFKAQQSNENEKSNVQAKSNPVPKDKQYDKPQSNGDNAKQDSHNKKTQPLRDKFEPIAFAGYTLISALNKLYIAKRV